jgi:transcription elongation GreA/GreB family factor
MNKALLQQQVLEQLADNLRQAEQAALTAYEAATHEENIAENKYDTLGLEASYLAAGQARRVDEIRQAISQWTQLQVRPYDEQHGIQLGALVWLSDAQGTEQCLFIGPEGAGMKLSLDEQEIRVISPRSPLGQRLIGRTEGDTVELRIGAKGQTLDILRAL